MAEVMILSNFWINSNNDVEFGHDRKTINCYFELVLISALTLDWFWS